LLTLPAATALAILALPILEVLFQRGAFGPGETAATASALVAYSAGLPAFVLVKVLAPAFFARHDTKTPVKVAILSLATNLVLTLILMQFLAHVGVAIALSAAGWLQAAILAAVLARRGDFRFDGRARANLPRIAAATIGMAAVLIGLRIALAPLLTATAAWRLAALGGLVAAGLLAFLLLVLAFGVTGWRELRGQFGRQPA
ncbi:MAG TPA: lipid II flippase MurJ, partial [Stellaceae bacterium]|nr:lipid II flippase MurJ [Stellaceae bacterium]